MSITPLRRARRTAVVLSVALLTRFSPRAPQRRPPYGPPVSNRTPTHCGTPASPACRPDWTGYAPSNDGRRITLRQLLRHTSGLPDYLKDVVPEPGAAGYRHHRWTTYTPGQRVALALRHPPASPPGTRWEYSNTNYVLAGMVIKAATGRSWEREVADGSMISTAADTGGYWGHAGTGFGYVMWPAVTPDGRSTLTVSTHSRPGDNDTAVRQIRGVTDLADHALCAAQDGRDGPFGGRGPGGPPVHPGR
ncbi:serine hydrolase domain-containing protein [Streptomyces nigrescens]|uniref:serine hydrolase domain-containing protein n=1 Tax=Streptomyces nigrescens TaxID=1920 RepID=UPI0036968841